MATSDYLDQVQKLYIAYFGRPADPTGLNYWANQVNAEGGDMAVAIAGFAASTESTNLFGALPSAQKISAIYLNLFNRLPESTGLSYWMNQLDSGAITQAQAAWEIMNQAGAGDVTSVANKLAMANIFTAQVDTAAEIAGYNGAQPAAYGRAYLASVDATPGSVSIATGALNNSVADATGVRPAPPVVTTPPAPATVFTTGTDNFTTTDSTLVYTATLGGASPTLTANDSLHGAGNTLNITDTTVGSQDVLPTGLSLTGVSTLNLTTAGNAGTSSASLDARIAGLSNFTLHSSGTNTEYLRGGSVALTLDSQAPSIQITSGWGSLDITDNHLTGPTALALAGTGGAITLHAPTGATALTIAMNAMTLTGGFTDADNHITSLTLAGTTNSSSIDAISDSALTNLTITGKVSVGTSTTAPLVLGANVTSLDLSGQSATSGTSYFKLSGTGTGGSFTFGTSHNFLDLNSSHAGALVTVGTDGAYTGTTSNLTLINAPAGLHIGLTAAPNLTQTTAYGTTTLQHLLAEAALNQGNVVYGIVGPNTFVVESATGVLGSSGDTTIIGLVGHYSLSLDAGQIVVA